MKDYHADPFELIKVPLIISLQSPLLWRSRSRRSTRRFCESFRRRCTLCFVVRENWCCSTLSGLLHLIITSAKEVPSNQNESTGSCTESKSRLSYRRKSRNLEWWMVVKSSMVWHDMLWCGIVLKLTGFYSILPHLHWFVEENKKLKLSMIPISIKSEGLNLKEVNF